MKEILKNANDFKIVPNNFKSSGLLNLIEIKDEKIYAKLYAIEESDLEEYQVGSSVEVFAVNEIGLIYFEVDILERNGYDIVLSTTQDYSLIQRREYSRVSLNQGKILFKDKEPDFVKSVEDISAGGIKIIAKYELDVEKKYDIEISLANNMNISCNLQPIRVTKLVDGTCQISGKFSNLENVDRIVLVQYVFKINMEEQTKEN